VQQNEEHSLSDSQTRQLLAVEVIMARHGLYDAAFQQVVMLCQTSKSLHDHSIVIITLISFLLALQCSRPWFW